MEGSMKPFIGTGEELDWNRWTQSSKMLLVIDSSILTTIPEASDNDKFMMTYWSPDPKHAGAQL